jgi:hypothetical protein
MLFVTGDLTMIVALPQPSWPRTSAPDITLTLLRVFCFKKAFSFETGTKKEKAFLWLSASHHLVSHSSCFFPHSGGKREEKATDGRLEPR